jgi:hypothetical protein
VKYRKKPIVIEAIQFTGKNCYEVLAFMGAERYIVPELSPTDCPVIHTLEGKMNTSPGDWVIKGVKGEFYPCKPDIFAATYEKVE